jgi:PAS domain S-box-containing protein
MKEQNTSKKQLNDELVKLRQRNAELEKTEIKPKEAGEALKESQERYETFFDRSLCCVCVHDFEGRFLDANKAALKLLGYTKKELLSMSLFSLIEEDQLSGAFKTFKKIKKTGSQKKHSEYKLRRKDGRYVWVETEGSVIYREGKPYAIQTVGRDITARKRTEEDLLVTKNRLHSLFEGIPVGLYRSTPEGKRLEANRALLRMTRSPNRETFLKGNVIDDYVNPEDRKKWQAKMEREGTVRDFNAQCRRHDGTVIWIRDSARTVRDSEGRILYYEGAVEDITERMKAEEKEKQYASNLTFLSRTAMEFVELPPRSNIYKFIGKRLRELVDNSFVLVNSFDETTQCIKVQAFSGARKEIESIQKILKKNPVGMSFPISEEARAEISTGRLVKVPGGLYVLSFEKIPKHICNTLEKLFNLGDIFTMGFTKEGKIFGNAVIITRDKGGLRKKSLIETFIGQASVALQRRRAEEELKKYQEHLEELVEERTTNLKSANKRLKREIAERKKVEQALIESESKLQKQKLALEQKNIALREIIAQIEVEKRKIKNDIETNINTVVSPILKKLEIERAPLKYVDLLQYHLKKLTSSFGSKITEKNLKLTPREIEICNMIKGGLTSKDISNLLSISYRTVEKHRRNIRQKIGISNKNINLTSFLHNL